MSVFINNKIQLIKKFYTGSLKKQLDKYDVSRSSFYHGFVEKEKLQPMYEEVRDKIMFTQNIIVIAIALGLAIISAFITCITGIKL